MSWDSYPVERDGRTHWISWHIPAYGRAPDRTRPIRVDIEVSPREVDEAGLPTEAERARLAELTEALEIDVCDATDGKYVLRTTGDGKQVHTFYAPRVKGFFFKKRCEVAVAKVVAEITEEFEGYTLTTHTAEDEEWDTFMEAFPSPDAVQWFHDANAVGKLAAEGDPLTGPRELRHWLFFDGPEARAEFITAASAAGFAVREELDDDEDPERTCGIIVAREEDSLDVRVVHPAVLALIALAEEVDGAYERWEAAAWLGGEPDVDEAGGDEPDGDEPGGDELDGDEAGGDEPDTSQGDR